MYAHLRPSDVTASNQLPPEFPPFLKFGHYILKVNIYALSNIFKDKQIERRSFIYSKGACLRLL